MMGGITADVGVAIVVEAGDGEAGWTGVKEEGWRACRADIRLAPESEQEAIGVDTFAGLRAMPSDRENGERSEARWIQSRYPAHCCSQYGAKKREMLLMILVRERYKR
jgi:hypothetical protein